MKSIISEGSGAFILGRPLDSNPYQKTQAEHGHWIAGWRRQLLLESMADPDVVYQNPWIKIEKVQDQHWVTYAGRNGSVIMPVRIVNDEYQVLLVKVFRHLAGGIKLELPRGGSESRDRDARGTALRELVEETGYAVPSQRLDFLGDIHPDSGLIKGAISYFLAWVMETDKVNDNLDEVDEAIWIPLEELKGKIAEGQITDSFTICALMLFESQGRGRPGFPENYLG